MSMWDKFRKQPAKKFKPSGDDKPERNSFDCLLKPAGNRTPDRSSGGHDSNISCIPETPSSMIGSPYGSPTFPGQKQTPGSMVGSSNDTKTNGQDVKRGVKRRFRLMSDSSDPDASPHKPVNAAQPTSPVFGVPVVKAVQNGHMAHTCAKGTGPKETEFIDITSDSDEEETKTPAQPLTPPPRKPTTAGMGLSPSPVVAEKKSFRRIMQMESSNDKEDSEQTQLSNDAEDSEQTQLNENQKGMLEDIQKRFPNRPRDDLLNTLVALDWSLFEAIQTLEHADSQESSEDGEEEEEYSVPSKSTEESSSGWFSKTTPPKLHLRRNGENSWESSSENTVSQSSSYTNSEQSGSMHTCRRGGTDKRRKPRAVAIPDEYQRKTFSKKSVDSNPIPSKPTNSKPRSSKLVARRRIKPMVSSSDDDDSVLNSKQTDKKRTAAISSDDEASEANSRTSTPVDDDSEINSRTVTPVDDNDEDEEAGGEEDDDSDAAELYDDDMPLFNKLVVSFFNDSTLEELVGIDECSAKKAQKIVAMRPFEDFKDLMARMAVTKGLGEYLVWNAKGIFQEREVVVFLMNKCACIAERIQGIISSQMESEDGGAHITEEPSTMNPEHKLKPYQMIGLNWLALLHKEGVSGILADEMGLGKTVQTIAFLAYLLEKGNQGPHVIVVPSSTLDNWARETMKWCPALEVLVYTGSQDYRAEMRYEILNEGAPFDVIITTYNTCASTSDDRALFRKIQFQYAIFDEGHMLKNMNSNRYQHLMKVNSKRRLLLTGTPLQNNLMELISLVSFIMPHLFMNKAQHLKRIFSFHKLKSKGINTEQSSFEEERIAHAKMILQPFMLRRIKADVLKQLPPKIESVEHVDMTADQQEKYTALRSSLSRQIREVDKSKTGARTSHALMELRKMANHPLLLRHHYDDEKLTKMARLMLKEPTHYDANADLIHEDMCVMTDYELHRLCHEYAVLTPFRLEKELILESGKFKILDKMLPKLKEEGSRVLLFSQFVMVLDIVEPYMKQRGYKYLRLDGQTAVSDRIELIDKFNQETDIFIFLLSTRAGGLGINLTAANVVILHDIDYNPYNDKQAEDRCHRVGQTREVIVTRLISKGTIEEAMLKCAQNKLRLEKQMTSSKEDDDDANVATMLKDALEL